MCDMMVTMIDRIQVFCFVASYGVALLLEGGRVFTRFKPPPAATLVFSIAGFLAQTLFLVAEARRSALHGLPISDWRDWCLLTAWILAAVYIAASWSRPKAALGLFLLPLVLAIIAVGNAFKGVAGPFPREEAPFRWEIVHGLSLSLGTVVVTLGFAAGVMYLIQSYRLKHHLSTAAGVPLPSLEWLQRINEGSFIYSSLLLLGGLVSGVVLNGIRHANQTDAVPWTDPVVWTSGVLFLWLLAAVVFNFVYQPARIGRKVAYLTVASFLFLSLELSIVLLAPSQHATRRSKTQNDWPDMRGSSAVAEVCLTAPPQRFKRAPREVYLDASPSQEATRP